MASAFSREYLAQQLIQRLGESLSDEEIERCLIGVEIVEPPIAKQFWQATTAPNGIYIVLGGKVRLLDGSNNLITTLTTGASFGELTLFTEEEFNAYVARASVNLKVAYFPQASLQEVIRKHPSIRDRLKQRAELWDLLLLCCQSSLVPDNGSVEGVFKALSLFECHVLEGDSLPVSLFQDTKLWLLHQGELVHRDGRRLTPGNIYVYPQQENWQGTESTKVYSLKNANWRLALQSWPELAELAKLQEGQDVTENTDVEVITPRKVRQLPQPDPKLKKRQKRAYFPSPRVKAGHWWGRLTKRYPFFEQQSAADCGAACLVMISRYWGKRLSVNRVRDLANINRTGASLRGLTTAAESIGFTTRPVKASLDKLAQQTLPAIAHWEGKHYIVVYEIRKKQVIVGDPALSQRTLTHEEFKAGWTGYALLLQPTSFLEETEETSTQFWQLFDLVKPHGKVLLEVFVASVFIQVFGLVTPLLTQLLLDRVLVQRSTLTLNAVGFGLLIFGLFSVLINGLRQYLLDHTANRISVALLVGFIKHTFRLPLAFFESRYVGDIISRVQENYKIQRFLTGEALSITLDLLTVFIYVGLMFWYSAPMALLSLSIIPPFFILAVVATPFFRRINREAFNATANENSYLIQSLTGISSIRSMAIEQTVRWHWEELLNNVIKKTFAGQIISNKMQIFSSGIETLVSTGLLWFGAWLVIQNELTIGQLVAFNMLLGNIIRPFQRLVVLWNQFQEVVISSERINDVLEAEPEEDLQHQPRQFLPRLQGHIKFENVTFRYHPESDINVLENLSFEILPEQTVAVVGRSGSGKTTLAKLILGLYLPTDGKVLIDAQDVTSISLRSLRSQIGVVDQDTFLFGGTIRENISIAHPEATLEEIIEAATLAGADEFIKLMPTGYETQIGEGGGMLSGGQRQRVAIARALLGNPRLLLLDEATSHLDAESERIIQNNLKTILKGRTSLIIAHRLSTVRHADLILVLDRGLLVESGTHDELIARRGHYFYLNEQQLAQTTQIA
ncbi:peptidase domain-containing ABC transporter [Umezakia ovalisporum]|jgi:ATP-binding cassette subfamily B protein|uniref:Peptidase domain-containing ABC transporter n=2 Tax=Umezakia ovalisporum TaxID=75695 RepID=A0AA43KEP1_9CYAN|nr:peptidase domain-containing ABC transporter [Umezakia ovalisporum]MBI1241677.1 ATP-binding cassette domain-containing protein [Nostoc sp. RI_552]MDH6055847.1 peptidase domain-containing ABC transporter [Umezakia ovalisporum FSS-43]MDH6063193.1 peptidase domain-containing ABC transporter [Umezakia ovalisporum FSS-62]MDH6070655.1 peptidase domain-containing ABC transporter [Umezakia ovalisporum CobakiLakeA]MDH6075071.1 peptidase domain-containing ABC transporter [Umezakia ovalisporum CS-1034]